MEVGQHLLLVLSSIGVFNGLALAFYFLLVIRPKELHNYFLGGLLLMLSIRIGKSVIYYFLPGVTYLDVYLQIGLSACFLIGPFLYLFVYYFVKTAPVPNLWKYHLAILVSLILIIGAIFPLWHYKMWWLPYGFHIISFQWLLYIILSGLVLVQEKGLFSAFKTSWKNKTFWVLSIWIGTLLIWTAYTFAATGLTSYLLGAITFSFVLYLLISLLLMTTNERSVILFKNVNKYGGRQIKNETADAIIEKLHQIMSDEKLYCNPNLKLNDVAQLANVSTHQLSQIINEKLSKNFVQWVNEYRITKAKTMILENDQYTLEAIGYDCGFNAKSTFYATFKRHTGITPAQFKKEAAV